MKSCWPHRRRSLTMSHIWLPGATGIVVRCACNSLRCRKPLLGQVVCLFFTNLMYGWRANKWKLAKAKYSAVLKKNPSAETRLAAGRPPVPNIWIKNRIEHVQVPFGPSSCQIPTCWSPKQSALSKDVWLLECLSFHSTNLGFHCAAAGALGLATF